MKKLIFSLLLLLGVATVFAAPPKPASTQKATDETMVPLDNFVIPEGFELTVWAHSPMLYNPTNMDIDYKGRVWVAEGVNYRGSSPRKEGDRIIVLEDTTGDGKADKSHTFVQEEFLLSPLGIAVIDNKIVVSQPPDLIVYTDVNRNAIFEPEIDKREVLLTGFNGRNHDHSLHSVTAGPSGQWYFNFGNMGGDVTDKEGWNLKSGSPYSMREIAGKKSSDGHVYLGATALRMNPDGTGMRPIGHNFRNSYEQTVTSYGDVFQNDNDDPPACRTAWLMEYGNAGYASLDGQRSWGSEKRWGQDTPTAEWRQEDPGSMPSGDVYGGGAPTGIVFYENGALGDEHSGTLLSCEPTRNTIFAYQPVPDGAGFKLERKIFVTTNPESDFAGADFRRGNMGQLNTLFRPSDVSVGPDGAIYIADWFDARVGGHATHDKGWSGTIYRLAPKGAKLSVPSFDIKTTKGQIAALKSPAVNVRNLGFVALQAQGEAVLRDVQALFKEDNHWVSARAVWLMAQLGPKGVANVEKLLKAKDPQVRILAFRALRRIEHRVLEHAAILAKDSSVAVRREVTLALRDRPLPLTTPILLDLAKGYDGKDRWYLEAFGAACAGQEAQVYSILKKSVKSDPASWNEKKADFIWRLHPASALKDLKARALNASYSFEHRKKMMVAIGIMGSQQAAIAMADIARSGPDDSKAEANRWIALRHKNLWRAFDGPGLVSGTKTPKVEYVDSIVPKALGATSTLPSEKEILALKGDAAKGKVLISRCVMCHKVGNLGVEFGPNLSDWGKGQTREVILKSIVDPDVDISHGFEGQEIKTTSGKTIQGYPVAEGNPVVLKVFGGDTVAIDAPDIASRTKLKHSLMVPAAKMGLSAQDVRDLVEYLKMH